MSQTRTNLEVIAPSLEEAVAKGLADLGLTEDEVEIEVLDAGSKGLFGLGSRQARIRLVIKSSAPMASPAFVKPAPAAERIPPAPVAAPAIPEPPSDASESLAPQAPTAEPVAVQDKAGLPAESLQAAAEVELSPEDEQALAVAGDTVTEILKRLKVKATVVAQYGEPDDEQSRAPLIVDVRGDDLSILIGPQAETLNALQYIVNLIVGKELGRSVPLMVDVEGYRMRRSRQIRQLARRMADQALKTGRRQVLEPMPANERRLIHIELRHDSGVITESVGEDPHRKVTIIPVK